MGRVIQRLLLFILACIALIPFYVIFIGAFKTNSGFFEIPPDLMPFNFILDNFKYIIGLKLYKNLFNSLIISSSTLLLTVFVSSCAGYAFAKKNFIGKNILFVLLLATMMIPRQIMMVPIFVILRKLGLFDNFLGLILPAAAAPFGVFLLKQFMQTIPNELLDAAKIDGASEIRIFMRLILPLSKAPIAALSIFVFIASFNDFFWQLVIISSQDKYPLPMALASLMQIKMSLYGYQLAGAAFSAIPMIIIFIVFQRFFTEGITLGALKG